MSYKDIILRNAEHTSPGWWPHYAYHFTDVSNAVSILESGMLYSRINAEKLDIMMNDNASRQVISMTSPETASFVRFYFRPLTPTQYHNEGYKHRDLRYEGDPNANVPVPVFFFFRLEQLLDDPDAGFSEGSEAGYGNPVFHGEAAFSALKFDMIYRNGPLISQDAEGKKQEVSYRHSEILYPEKYQIDRSLAGIVCRNAEERSTLLNLLKDKSYRLFSIWQSRIRIINQGLYYNNGLYIAECSLHDKDFSISFSEAFPRIRYAAEHGRDCQIKIHVLFEWLQQSNVLYRRDFEWNMNYFDPKPVSFHGLPEIKKANELSVKIWLDNHLMCYRRYFLLKGAY